jgi:putative tricarboxylic transport membrane protein
MSAARRQIGRADLWLGVVALGAAAGYLYQASLIPESLLADPVGAKGLPLAIGWAMAVLGLVLCLRSVLFRAGAAESPAATDAPSSAMAAHLAALGLLAILAVYVVVLPYAGYVVATAVLIGAVARFSGAAFDRDLLLVAIAGGVVLWLLFDPLLGISLPAGSWWPGR